MFASATTEPFVLDLAALTRLDIITASSHQNDSADTRLDAKRSKTAEVERSIRPIHVPMTV